MPSWIVGFMDLLLVRNVPQYMLGILAGIYSSMHVCVSYFLETFRFTSGKLSRVYISPLVTLNIALAVLPHSSFSVSGVLVSYYPLQVLKYSKLIGW